MAYLARIDDGVKTGGDNWPGSTEDDVDGVDKWQSHQCRKHEVRAEALGETHDGEEASWTRQKRATLGRIRERGGADETVQEKLSGRGRNDHREK